MGWMGEGKKRFLCEAKFFQLLQSCATTNPLSALGEKIIANSNRKFAEKKAHMKCMTPVKAPGLLIFGALHQILDSELTLLPPGCEVE